MQPHPVHAPIRPAAMPRPDTKPQPGAKLLCVDDRGLKRTYCPGPPVRGHIYCLRELYTDHGEPGVLLAGIVGPRNGQGLECGFFLRRFRWVHE